MPEASSAAAACLPPLVCCKPGAPAEPACSATHPAACRKACPINHGPCSPDRLLETAAGVVRTNFIERANSIQFNMIALAAAESDS